MKTLFKTYTDFHTCIKKRKEFEEKTGINWNFFSTEYGMKFCPIVTVLTPTDEILATKLLPFLIVDYKEFITLHEISKMPLSDVLIASQTLTNNGKALAGRNRMGNFASIRIKTKYESIVKQSTKTPKVSRIEYSI